MAVIVVRTMLITTDHLFFVSGFIFDVFVKFVTFVNSLFVEQRAALLPCHCADEFRPVFLREPLQASEARP